MAFADQVAVEAACGREQAGQAAAGLALEIEVGDQPAQALGIQCRPGGQLLALAVGQQLAQVAAIAVEGMQRHLTLAAQVFEVGIQLVLHGSSRQCVGWVGPRRLAAHGTRREHQVSLCAA
ncbi:hypothetical protein D9M68_856760 [compost metagenome]